MKGFLALCVLFLVGNTGASDLSGYLIYGQVYFDLNGNHSKDSGEPGIEHVEVVCGGESGISDENGNYRIYGAFTGRSRFSCTLEVRAATIPGGLSSWQPVIVLSPDRSFHYDFGVSGVFTRRVFDLPEKTIVHVSGDLAFPNIFINGDLSKGIVEINRKQVKFTGASAVLETRVMDLNGKRSVAFLDLEREDLILTFRTSNSNTREIEWWKLTVFDGAGEKIYLKKGFRRLPASVTWDGRDKYGRCLLKNRVYHYQFEVQSLDGQVAGGRIRYFVTGGNYLMVFRLPVQEKTGRKLAVDSMPDLPGLARRFKRDSHLNLLIEAPLTPESDRFLSDIRGSIKRVRYLSEKTIVLRTRATGSPVLKVLKFPEISRTKGERGVWLDGKRVRISRNRFFQILSDIPENREAVLEIKRDDGIKYVTRIRGKRISAEGMNRSSVKIFPINSYFQVSMKEYKGRLSFKYLLSGRAPAGSQVRVEDRAVRVSSRGIFRIPIMISPGENSYGIEVRNEKTAIYAQVLRLQAFPVMSGSQSDERSLFVLYLPEQTGPAGSIRQFMYGYAFPQTTIEYGDKVFVADAYGRFSGVFTHHGVGRCGLRVPGRDRPFEYTLSPSSVF